ncbi:MAG TPA: ABC transporter substrate-binding protein [Acidimicrobiia bacterium]|nr:ABC transporter substrate-binding protein [Acidimicrobiia bacterium]
MRPRSILKTIALIAVLAMMLTACDEGESVDVTEPSETTAPADTSPPTEPDDGEESPDTTAEMAPEEGGTLIAAQGAEPDRLDPHLTSAYASFQILENVYDTLVQPGDDLTMEPALADSWDVSDDQLTWTFTLREGVTFHNGRELVADDVVYSYERIMDPETAANNAFRFASIESVTAPDDQTVEITLTRPTPNLLVNIGAFKGMAIIPQEIVEDGSIDSTPVGTGPFKFVSSSPDQGILLERNEDYWQEGLPHLDEIRFIQIPDATVKLTNLQTGEVDWIDSVPPQNLADLEGDDSVVLERVPGGDYHYFALNQAREPFDNPDVRRAISMAIDRETIAEAAQFGAATPNQTAIPEGNFWYHDYSPFTSGDIEGAQELLEAAGASDLSIEFMVSSEFPETVTQAQVIASQLEALGVTVEISDVDFGTWLDRQGQGDFDAFMLSWIGNIDPDDFYYAQHHTEGSFNFQGYSNPEVDQLLDDARVETDDAARKALYDQAVEMIVDDASYTYLYNPENIGAWAPHLEGYQVRGDNAVRFVEARLNR